MMDNWVFYLHIFKTLSLRLEFELAYFGWIYEIKFGSFYVFVVLQKKFMLCFAANKKELLNLNAILRRLY